MKKPELLAPAGDLEKLKIAFQYGADAVYASTPHFSMRTREIGFDEESLDEGIKFAHKLKKKVYLTLNVFPHASEISELKKHIKKVVYLKPDAVIIADPGALNYFKGQSDIPIHLSTQANTTNQLSCEFWRTRGVKRIVLARELSHSDIKTISKESKVEIETFIHGAMCMAYSGRCQISNYMVGRDPNHGECVQPCRFKYRLYELEEDLRPGERFQIHEDDDGSYLFNSKDLCMIEYIPELIDAGIISFKIEGRMKSIYYLGSVVRAYRQAIDLYFKNPIEYSRKKTEFMEELKMTSNRGFTTGFYFGKPDQNTNNYESSRSKEKSKFIGHVLRSDGKYLTVRAKNHFEVGDFVELVSPNETYPLKVAKIFKNDEESKVANPNDEIKIPSIINVPNNCFLRIKV